MTGGMDEMIGLGVVISLKDALSAGAGRVISKLEELEQKAKGSAAGVTTALREMKGGFALFLAGAAVLAGLNAATGTAQQFSSAIARVSTVVDSATISTAQLRKTALDLSATYGGGAAKQADALYYTLSTGIKDAAKATDMLGVANRFAIGGVTDVTTATRGLAYVTAAYAAQNVSAAHAADLLFKTSAAGLSTPEELAQSIGLVADTAANTGVRVEELAAAIGTATQSMTSESAIAGFRQMLANISHPMKTAREEAARLGVEFNSAHLRSVGFAQFLHEIVSSAKYTPESLEKLFHSVEGRSVAMALAAEQGQKFVGVLNDMQHAAGASDEAFRKVAGTSEFQQKLLDAGVNRAIIAIGAALEPVKARIIGALASIVAAFNRLPEPVINLLTRFVALSAALASVAGLFLMAKGALYLYGVAAAYVGPILTTMWGSLAAAAPWFVAIAAAAGLLYLAWTEDFGGIKTAVLDWYNSIALVVEGVVELFGSSSGGVGQIPQKLHQQLVDKGLWPIVRDLFVWGERIRDFYTGLWAGFKAGAQIALAPLGLVLRAVVAITDGLGWLYRKVAQVFGAPTVAGTRVMADSLRSIGKLVGVIAGAWVAVAAAARAAAVAQGAMAIGGALFGGKGGGAPSLGGSGFPVKVTNWPVGIGGAGGGSAGSMLGSARSALSWAGVAATGFIARFAPGVAATLATSVSTLAAGGTMAALVTVALPLALAALVGVGIGLLLDQLGVDDWIAKKLADPEGEANRRADLFKQQLDEQTAKRRDLVAQYESQGLSHGLAVYRADHPEAANPAAPAQAGAQPQRSRIELNVNLDGKALHRSVVEHEQAVEERTYGAVAR